MSLNFKHERDCTVGLNVKSLMAAHGLTRQAIIATIKNGGSVNRSTVRGAVEGGTGAELVPGVVLGEEGGVRRVGRLEGEGLRGEWVCASPSEEGFRWKLLGCRAEVLWVMEGGSPVEQEG